jgi:hypothetical protein
MIINGKRFLGLQAYKEKGKDSYLYVHHDASFFIADLMYECYAGLTENCRIPNCSSSCSVEWLYKNCRPMSFKKLPVDVQKHLVNYVSQGEERIS